MSDILLDAKEHVILLLKDLISKGYYFHNLDHTLDVFNRVTYLCDAEGVSSDQKELVQLSALFHDTGFAYSYDDNEKLGAEIAGKYLQQIGYDEKKIYIVKQNILATIPFRKPNTLLEKIIKDGDLDNLGRDDCFIRSDSLREEFFAIKGMSFSEKDRIIYLYNFINKQIFFCATQISERTKKLEENKYKLKQIMQELL